MAFLYVKALHIIFIVTWFAGLFYIVRLFVYFSETKEMQEPQKSILQAQYLIMERRLWYGIAWPSAVLTFVLGTTLIVLYGFVPNWLWLKLGFVVLLYTYHYACHAIFKQHTQGLIKYTSNQMRVFNEVPTLLLFAIIFLVILKNTFSWVYGLGILALLVGTLLIGIRTYKKIREKGN